MPRFTAAPPSLDWDRVAYLRDHAPATIGDLRGADRTVLSWGSYQIVYAPYDASWNRNAKVILLGLTPGLAQAQEANTVALEMIAHGRLKWDASLTAHVRARVAFKASMRTNLIRMLDAVGLPQSFT